MFTIVSNSYKAIGTYQIMLSGTT